VAAKKAVNNAVHDEVEAFLQDNAGPDAPRMENVQLQGLFADADVETMEKGVERGLQLLKKIEASLEGGKDLADVDAFKQQIQNIRKQAEQKRTVIGVVGNTGAGKSSVINALLDEERLGESVSAPIVLPLGGARVALRILCIGQC
jgi:ribosome biogenesis GTPase A